MVYHIWGREEGKMSDSIVIVDSKVQTLLYDNDNVEFLIKYNFIYTYICIYIYWWFCMCVYIYSCICRCIVCTTFIIYT